MMFGLFISFPHDVNGSEQSVFHRITNRVNPVHDVTRKRVILVGDDVKVFSRNDACLSQAGLKLREQVVIRKDDAVGLLIGRQ